MNNEKKIAYPINQRDFKSIKEWSDEDKPREKMIKSGPESLTNSELVAIILSSGTTGISAIDLSRSLLGKYSDLNNLAKRSISELTKIKGIGPAKAVSLVAAFELGRRTRRNPFDANQLFAGPDQVSEYYISKMADYKAEVLIVALLNAANRLFREVKVSEGILDQSLIHSREVFREAIAENAAAIILIHNHPSGNPLPSREDIAISKQLAQAGEIIGIKVLDHLIIAGDRYTSMKMAGYF